MLICLKVRRPKRCEENSGVVCTQQKKQSKHFLMQGVVTGDIQTWSLTHYVD